MEERKIFCMEERKNLNKKKSNSKCQTRLMNIR